MDAGRDFFTKGSTAGSLATASSAGAAAGAPDAFGFLLFGPFARLLVMWVKC